MSLKKLLNILLGIQFALGVGLVILTVCLFLNQVKLSKSQEIHFQSYLLADELRQSSDDLTRLARTYAATGNEKYEREYWAVLDIRNGYRPRPEAYNRIYWDFVSGTGEKPRPDGAAVSLRDLMIKVGFTKAELEKLNLSQKNSDELVKAEMVAMNAVKGLFDNGAGNFTVKKKPDRELALRLMNDENYHKNKVNIMKPIDEFYAMFAERTAGDVAKYERRSLNLFLSMGVLIIVIVGMFLYSFVTMKRQVIEREKATEALAEQNRSKTGQAALNERMRGDHAIEGLAANIISYLCEYLKASIGAIYICREDRTLRLAGSYAFHQRKGLNNEFNPGEGLIGQAALEKKHILMTDCPADYIAVRSGLGSAVPKNILVYPLLINDEVEGVIELGAVKDFSENDLSFLTATAENITIALRTVIGRSKREVLLKKTQQQADELQSQQEELKAAIEELEEQTKALRASEEILQTQQEELRALNEEMAGQLESREKQKKEIMKKNEEIEKARDIIEQKAKDLELTSKYKSEFLANMSHELRTPLNSILLLSKLLAENKGQTLSAKQVEFSETIYSSGNDLLNLINDVLDLAKVESGRLEINVSEVNLKKFADRLSRCYEKIAEEKGIGFSVNIEENVPETIRTDPQRVEQIVKNLLSNALKFTEQGKIALNIQRPKPESIFSRGDLLPEHTVAFAVSDTGIGIKMEKQQIIFEAFQQEDGTTSRKYGGTGLGLSISRELANCLRGEISLVSEQGRGSTFTLYLPEAIEELSKEPTQTLWSTPPTSLPAEGSFKLRTGSSAGSSAKIEQIRDDRKNIITGDKCILVIEDDPKFSTIMSDLAKERGFKVLVAGDGETGLHFADLFKPSAIILDIGLPGIDGWEVLTRLKDAPTTRHIPVHLISASDQSWNAMQMGAIGYLTKPVSMEQINRVFSKIEQTIIKKVKKLLVVEDIEQQREAIVQLLDCQDVEITVVSTGLAAYEHLQASDYQCMILDPLLPDMPVAELLDKVRGIERLADLPIIIHTGKVLSDTEKALLDKYSGKIILKDAHSPEKLLDETSLFLHWVEAELPDEKKQLLKLVHDKEAILSGKSVLVVDDDMRNVFALTNILEDKGIKVLVANNGHEALFCLAERADVDMVLMDIMMPEMDGYEAIQKIRKQGKYQKLPIIALTAKAMKGDRAKCIEAGASDYLAKPVDSSKLLSMLRVWLYK